MSQSGSDAEAQFIQLLEEMYTFLVSDIVLQLTGFPFSFASGYLAMAAAGIPLSANDIHSMLIIIPSYSCLRLRHYHPAGSGHSMEAEKDRDDSLTTDHSLDDGTPSHSAIHTRHSKSMSTLHPKAHKLMLTARGLCRSFPLLSQHLTQSI